MSRQIHHFINGTAVPGQSGRTGPVYNPSRGDIQAEVALASADDVRSAIAAAEKALPEWSAVNPQRRARVMFRFKELVERNMDDLARLLSSEHGKTIADAKGDVQRGLEVIEFACGIPHLLKGEFTEGAGPGIDMYSMRQPLGVVAGITPFNFPAMIPMWMFGVAIACGNTFVCKPSEKDPSVPVRLAELMMEAGAPEGVLNVVHGDKEAVDTLLTDPRIQAVSFVGSSAIAQYIYSTGAANGKRVQAMGGAKNHAIIMPDADLDNAVSSLMGAAYGSCGERCMAISVAVAVGDGDADALVDRLGSALAELRVGPGDDSGSDMGPLITQQHLEKVRGYLELGIEEGAELVVDGRNASLPAQNEGFFLGPCLFDHVTPDMRICQEEIFGPVLSVLSFRTEEEAVERANNTGYGLSAGIWTEKGSRILRLSRELEAGVIWANTYNQFDPTSPFGGFKESGFGREGGWHGLRAYLAKA